MAYWTHELVAHEALKYNTRNAFQKGSRGAYAYSSKHCILDEICKDMISGNGFWTYDLAKEEALKYNTRTEFSIGTGGAYNYAKRTNILNEICAHMKLIGHKYKRCIYVCWFSDNHCYIGLTYDIDERMKKRNRTVKDAVTIHKNETGLEYEYKQLTDYVDVEEAQLLECKYEEMYRDNGWITLNRTSTGGLGGSVIYKWTYELVIIEASKYNTRYEFQKGSKLAYIYALKNNNLDEICDHMVSGKGKWTHELVRIEALKYEKRNKFKKESGGAYSYANRNKILDSICYHMVKGNEGWTYELVRIEALKYETRNEFKKGSGGAYNYTNKHKLMDELIPK
jgi:predicted GIY-YIG superfamily endonuclease